MKIDLAATRTALVSAGAHDHNDYRLASEPGLYLAREGEHRMTVAVAFLDKNGRMQFHGNPIAVNRHGFVSVSGGGTPEQLGAMTEAAVIVAACTAWIEE